MGLKFCGGLLFGHIEDVAKNQLIRICLASTSFTKLLAEQNRKMNIPELFLY